MKNNRLFVFIICLFTAARALSQTGGGVQKFSINNILRNDKNKTKEVLNTGTMQVLVKTIRRNESPKPDVYTTDATFYFFKGEASATVGDGKLHIAADSVLYLHAGTALQVSDVKKELQVLIVFSNAAPNADDKPFGSFSLDDIKKKRAPGENDWEPFIRTKTIILGLYTLPKKVGGDSTLVHKMDELNYVTKSHCKFTVDDTTLNVKKGDIIFVAKGKGHYFNNLQGDFEVLIWWERKSPAK
jgi:mannose-6-phosphate isomerase-like protein (cupin superfamily)